MDQRVIEQQLALKTPAGLSAAQSVYSNGGHSKSYARVTLSAALGTDIAKGTKIEGFTSTGTHVTGQALAAFGATADVIEIQYSTKNNQDIYVDCQVGGLPPADVNTAGCEYIRIPSWDSMACI